MENYSHPDIPDILEKEGNSECVDCGEKSPKWASINNGVFLCLKCAGVHRSFGMGISLVSSLQVDSWTDNQLLYLNKGGNSNFKKNLQDFNIDISSASLDLKYKSKAADYYRRYLKNEVDRESDPNYIPTQIVKPDINVAQEIIEVKEEKIEEDQNKEQKEKTIGKKFFGFMNSILAKVKEGTSEMAQNVGKGFNELKLGEKFKTAGTAIAGAARNSGQFIAEKTNQAVHSEFVQNISNKTKEGINNIVEKTKTMMKKESNENKVENNEEKKEEGESSGEAVVENNNTSENKIEAVPGQSLDESPEK